MLIPSLGSIATRITIDTPERRNRISNVPMVSDNSRPQTAIPTKDNCAVIIQNAAPAMGDERPDRHFIRITTRLTSTAKDIQNTFK